MTKAIVGVIGGSGVYHLPGLTDLREEAVSTPWGEPSDVLRFGRIGGAEAVFLARHGRGHRFSPSTINYRANIDALKRVGVTDIIALSACGSFHRELYPGRVRADRPVRGPDLSAPVDLLRHAAASRTSRWRIRSRRCCGVASSPPRRRRASPSRTAARTSAWRGRSSPRSPSRSATRRAAPTSSA